MTMVKRVFLFLATNILIVATISIVLNLLGVQPYLDAKGINYQSLVVFCLVWGFGGAFISLALSKVMAKWMMGVRVIDPRTSDPTERWLVDRVYGYAQSAKLSTMPEVGVYESDEVNAFATGPTKSRSLVAVSTGLLRHMDKDEAEGVLAHEVAHIANGDMVTMTLIQGVVNALVMFFARVAGYAAAQAVDEEKRPWVQMIVVFVLEIVFSFLGWFVVAYFSRAREFRADAGGAKLAGRDRMVAALQSLQRTMELNDHAEPAVAAMKISSQRKGGLMALLSTHPPLEDRIARLQRMIA